MKLNELMKITKRSSKRLGRGLGSGKGKTVGRGTKGQKARGKVPASFMGGTMPLYKKLPYKRGFHRDGIHSSASLSKKFKVLNLDDLKLFKNKAEVTSESLVELKVIKESELRHGVKILGTGEIDKILTVKIAVSETARAKIEAAGGSVE